MQPAVTRSARLITRARPASTIVAGLAALVLVACGGEGNPLDNPPTVQNAATTGGQKLSFIINTSALPPWLNTLPGITTYTAGTPAVTRPLPWDAIARERNRLMLVALGNHVVDGVPFRDPPKLAVVKGTRTTSP